MIAHRGKISPACACGLVAECDCWHRVSSSTVWRGSAQAAIKQVAAGGGRIRRWPLEDWLCEAYNRGDPGQACGISPRASVSPSGVIHDSSIAITLGPRLLPSVPRFASGDSTGRPKRHLPSRLAAPLSFSQLSGSLLPRRPRRRRLRTRPTIARAPGRATRGAALSGRLRNGRSRAWTEDAFAILRFDRFPADDACR